MRYLSKTFTVELVSDKWDLGIPLRSSEDVFHFVESIYRELDADKEHFVLIVQNNKITITSFPIAAPTRVEKR